MSLESARKFMEKYKNDSQLAVKLGESINRAEKMAIAKAVGFDFTFEELAKANEELSEIELDAVVGGEWNLKCIEGGHCGPTCEPDGLTGGPI